MLHEKKCEHYFNIYQIGDWYKVQMEAKESFKRVNRKLVFVSKTQP